MRSHHAERYRRQVNLNLFPAHTTEKPKTPGQSSSGVFSLAGSFRCLFLLLFLGALYVAWVLFYVGLFSVRTFFYSWVRWCVSMWSVVMSLATIGHTCRSCPLGGQLPLCVCVCLAARECSLQPLPHLRRGGGFLFFCFSLLFLYFLILFLFFSYSFLIFSYMFPVFF